MGVMYARVVGIEGVVSIVHTPTPMIHKIMPIMGAKGIIGQRMRRARLTIPPIIMMIVPVMSRINLEKKPIMRETRRSINI